MKKLCVYASMMITCLVTSFACTMAPDNQHVNSPHQELADAIAAAIRKNDPKELANLLANLFSEISITNDNERKNQLKIIALKTAKYAIGFPEKIILKVLANDDALAIKLIALIAEFDGATMYQITAQIISNINQAHDDVTKNKLKRILLIIANDALDNNRAWLNESLKQQLKEMVLKITRDAIQNRNNILEQIWDIESLRSLVIPLLTDEERRVAQYYLEHDAWPRRPDELSTLAARLEEYRTAPHELLPRPKPFTGFPGWQKGSGQ